MTIAYFGRRNDAGELVGLFRAHLRRPTGGNGSSGAPVAWKGELLGADGWMDYPELIRYVYVTGELTIEDRVTAEEARAHIVQRDLQPDEFDLEAP